MPRTPISNPAEEDAGERKCYIRGWNWIPIPNPDNTKFLMYGVRKINPKVMNKSILLVLMERRADKLVRKKFKDSLIVPSDVAYYNPIKFICFVRKLNMPA
jgi:hypothetical protein